MAADQQWEPLHVFIIPQVDAKVVWHSMFYVMPIESSGPGSSVGIATDYGLDGPRSNPGGDEISRPSRPALRPTQPPVK